MDGSYNKTVRETVEECGRMRSGVRFHQEKRRRNEESFGVTGMKNYEKGPQGTKRPYNDEGDDQATPEPKGGPTQSYNIPTTLCIVSNLGVRNASSSQGFPACQHNGNSSGSTTTRRRHRMAGDDVKIPLFQGNGTKYP